MIHILTIAWALASCEIYTTIFLCRLPKRRQLSTGSHYSGLPTMVER